MDANVYAGSAVDRLGNRRKDPDAMARLRDDPDARLIALSGSRHLMVPDPAGEGLLAAMPRAAEAPSLARLLDDAPWVLLGTLAEEPVIAVDLGADDDAIPDGAPPRSILEDLRRAASLLPGADAALLAHARGLLLWRRAHRFCGVCGQACRPEEGGTVMRCTGCDTAHFPRTDPAVIMLVRHGERVLLARNARFGERRMLSALAGFVEPGETLEEAVAREVFEEAGIRVRDVRYHSSQPWPFPGSIMLGFSAEAAGPPGTTGGEIGIEIDGEEIIEAGFFSRDEIARRDELGFGLPPRTSIARRMIDDWCNEG